MPLLGISTVAETLVVVRHNDRMTLRVNTERRRQAEFLTPLVQDVVAEAGLKLSDISRIGVVTGPGSFTGLRVGIATAQGLALGINRPCVGIDAFMWWRRAARVSGLTAPLAIALDTLRDDVFIAAYDKPERYQRTLLDPQVRTAAEALAVLAENPFLSLIGDALPQLPEAPFVPVAHTALAEALLQLTHEADPTILTPEPVYLRAPETTSPHTGA